ncbi:hypothetical protein GGU10DRAFT_89357 [Lentinula aff. detonsa]|uniref:Uncharacterized protein n=1 Tax=Lentinula aff. detonsa TaxID=2804958 RepID=A0AA38KC51_9AGAR|nr:hypothetical protein GGU10DRAFT_89357 [Lentinula aff. detonsa]
MSIPLEPLPQSPSQSKSKPKPNHSLSTHLIFLTGLTTTCFLPLTLLPYLFARRRLGSLQNRVRELEGLYREMRGGWREGEKERRRVGGLMSELEEEVREGRRRFEMKMKMEMEMREKEMKTREKEREDECREIQSDIRYLLDQAKITRTQGLAVKSIGLSLADIASFIHQVELSMPTATATATDNKNRVDRLWVTALMLQNLKLK